MNASASCAAGSIASLLLIHRRKERVVELRGGGCEICGYSRCLRAITFHHLDPATKRFNVAGGHTRSWANFLAEARKCVLLCENCHREVESGITRIPATIERRIRRYLKGIERVEPRRAGRPALS